jgi:hypothetical protein
MKHRSSILRFVLAALVAVLAFGGAVAPAYADPTIAMRKCVIYACDSAISLKNEARAAYGYLPFGSIVFVSSEQYPLSAFVRICPGQRGGRDGCLITSGDLGAVELDNEVFARASKIEPIDIPADVATSASSAEWEIVEGWIFNREILATTGRTGWNPWHDLFAPLTWHWMEFYDYRTREFNRVHTKDRITFRFPDGSTAQAEMVGLGAASGHFFRLLPETIRGADGEPMVELAPPLPAYPAGAGIDLAPLWVDGLLGGALAFDWCAFLQSHCVFISGGYELSCYYRRQNFPCG